MEMEKYEIGDLVESPEGIGIVVGFNEKGEGGRHYVHVLIGDRLVIYGVWSKGFHKMIKRGQKAKRGSKG